jgi:hypothetical protein
VTGALEMTGEITGADARLDESVRRLGPRQECGRTARSGVS